MRRLLAPVLERQDEECLFEEAKASPAVFGYRNKMEFTFGDEVKDGPLSLGMHKRGSFYDIVSVTDCQIVDEDYRKILRCVRDYFVQLQGQGMDVSFYHRLRHTGWLRHLVVRRAAKTGEILVALVTTGQTPGRTAAEREILAGFTERLLALSLDGTVVGILHVRNDSAADVVQSDETTILYGRDYFYEELLGLRFKISLFSFFQTNSLGAELLYSTAREYISGCISASDKAKDEAGQKTAGKTVYDLYSGTGTIAQLMAPVAKKVIGVEIVEEAVEAAKRNAELNGLHNCNFVAGDVLKVLDGIEEKPDVIILDRRTSESALKDHRLRCRAYFVYFLQGEQSGKGSGSLSCERLCGSEVCGDRPVPVDSGGGSDGKAGACEKMKKPGSLMGKHPAVVLRRNYICNAPRFTVR